MNVGAVGAVGSGAAPVYAALSPYLNGVVRTSDAAAAAALQATTAAKSAGATAAAVAARSTATDAITAAPPFANPAITAIGERIALGQSLTPPAAVTPNALLATGTTDDVTAAVTTTQPTPTETVLYGDSGTLIQSYGAVALIAGTQSLPPVFLPPIARAIPPPAPVAAIPRLAKVA
jgi:hypothetical protein